MPSWRAPSRAALASHAFYEIYHAVTSHLAALYRMSRAILGFCALFVPNYCSPLGCVLRGAEVTAHALVDAEGRFLNVSVG